MKDLKILEQYEANFLDGEKYESNPSMFTVVGGLDIAEYFYELGREEALEESIALYRQCCADMSKVSPFPYHALEAMKEAIYYIEKSLNPKDNGNK